MSISQKAVTPSGWGVKFVCGWHVKLRDSLQRHYWGGRAVPVMLNYAGEYCEYGEYCDARQAA